MQAVSPEPRKAAIRYRATTCALWCAVAAAGAQANPDFNVTVNTGLTPPNANTVYPAEPTSLRITLSNNSVTTALNNVAYSGVLPDSGLARLLVNGASSINGDSSCLGGTLSTAVGAAGIQLSGLTVPARIDGVAGSGECYLDIPVQAQSQNGVSTSLSMMVGAGEVSYNNSGDTGSNGTGGSQAITVRGTALPRMSKSFSPNNTVVLGGDSRTLSIDITNPDAHVQLTGVGLVDIFPVAGAGGAVIEPTGTPASGSCVDGGAMVSLTQGAAAQVVVSGATVPPNGSCTVNVEVRGRHTNGDYELSSTNTIDNVSFSSNEGLVPASDASASVRVRSPLSVQKSFNPSVLASNTQGQFSITLTNLSDVALPIANMTDDPIGTPGSGNLSIATSGDIVNSCNGSANLESGGEGFSVGGFSIPANGNCTITVTYTGRNTDPDSPMVFTNQLNEGAVQVTGQPGIVSQPASSTLIVADRLRVLKSRSPSRATPGEPVRYEITVQNFSDDPLLNNTLTDSFQNGSTLLLGSGFEMTLTPAACGVLDVSAAAQGDSSITLTVPLLPGRTGPSSPGQCTVGMWVMIDPEASTDTSNVINPGEACLSGGSICNRVGSNLVTTQLLQPVEFIKTFDGQPSVSKREGTTTRLRLELRNHAPFAVNDLSLSDTLPNAGPLQLLRIASPANLSNSCGGTVTAVAGSTSIALNGGTAPARDNGNPGVCALEIDVVGPAGVYANTGQATGTRPNADGSSSPIAPIASPLSDTATVTYNSTLSASKDFVPDSVGPNGRATVNIVFENLDSNTPLTGISAVDPLPAGMVIANPAQAYTTCAGAPTVTATTGASQASISGATLAPGASCALVFDVSVEGSSDWVNRIPPGNITADGGIVNTSAVIDTLSYEGPTVPLISKSISPGTIVPGESSTLTINVTNGAKALTGVSLSDWFTIDGTAAGENNQMLIAPDPQAITDCPGAVVVAQPNSNNIRLAGASLAAGSACQVQVQVTSTSVGTITNRIPMNSIVSDQGATNSTTFAESTLSTTRAFGVSKYFTPAVVSPDQSSRLRIEFFNGGSSAVTGFEVTDTYPAGLENAADPNPITNCGGAATVSMPNSASVKITGGSIAAANSSSAASCFVEVSVVSDTVGTYVNEIPAQAVTVNGTPLKHPPVTGTLQVRDRIIVNKAIDDFTLDSGDPNGFATGNAARLPGVVAPLTIRLENPNTIALTQVSFTDLMPDGLSLAVTPNVSTSCADGVVDGASSGRELTLTGASLAAAGDPGSVCTVTADVFSNVPGIYTNEIPEGDVTSFEGVSNNPATQAQLVVSKPPAVAKTFDPPVIAPGSSSLLTLILGNDNEVAATLTADLIDSLPASPGFMVVASPANIATSCPGGTGIVTAVEGADQVVIDSGSVVPPGGCIVTVNVSASEPGDYLNNIPVAALKTTLGPNEEAAEAPLKVSTLGYISGKVFLDTQTVPDGQFIPGKSAPIASNSVELRSGGSCSGSVLATVATDAQGNYLFAELSAGTYSVCQPNQPAGTLNSIATAGTIKSIAGSAGTPGAAANASVTSSQVTGIELGNNGNADEVSGSPDNNFSEVEPASVAGYVYFDANNNGLREPGETGIGGVTVKLGGAAAMTTTTGEDGSYRFDGLIPGNYNVVETQPGGWTDGKDTRGTVDGVPVGDDSANDEITAIILGSGDAGIEYNFGEIAPSSLFLTADAVCLQDAAYVNYSMNGFDTAAAPTVTVRWITPAGRVVEQLENQPGSGQLLWPGTSLGTDGVGNGWPGWAFVNDQWVAVEDDRRPELTLELSFNPAGSIALRYPKTTSQCATQPRSTSRVEHVPATPVWMLLLTTMMMLCLVAVFRGRLAGVDR